MKYDIHVGDYVETKNSEVGWIDEIIYNDAPRVYLDISIRTRKEHIHGEFHGYEDDLGDHFSRIGRYDFDNPATYKIDHLKINPFDFEDNNSVKLHDKINELIDKVNYLLDKQDKA